LVGVGLQLQMDLMQPFVELRSELLHGLPIYAGNSIVGADASIRLAKEAGAVADGSWEETEIGSPQGGVISPLLCNIYLDAFDQEMMAQGIRIVRYADGILIFARSPRQAERYRETATQILEEDLRLVVNRQKTHIADAYRGVPFLGFVIYAKCVSIHPKRIKRFKDRVRLRQSPSQYGSSELLVRPTGSCRLDPV
jgi:RNA-directed DNA polymerase